MKETSLDSYKWRVVLLTQFTWPVFQKEPMYSPGVHNSFEVNNHSLVAQHNILQV